MACHLAADNSDEDRPLEDDSRYTVAGCAGHERAAGGRHGLANTLSEVQDSVQDTPASGADSFARLRLGPRGLLAVPGQQLLQRLQPVQSARGERQWLQQGLGHE